MSCHTSRSAGLRTPTADASSDACALAPGSSLTAAPRSASAFESRGESCLARHGIREAVSYQPASHYWPLQLIETGVFLALALALAGFCFWRLDRRLA
jgi:hypothetical protein